jgi:hypothetical protein
MVRVVRLPWGHTVTHITTAGPVAESVKNETAKTSNELSGLANARAQLPYTAANGQNLTSKKREPLNC